MPSIKNPVSPSTTASTAPPELPTITGNPVAEPSKKTMPSPSTSQPPIRVRHGIAKTSPAAYQCANCPGATLPVKCTLSCRFSLVVNFSSSFRYGPSPTMISPTPGTLAAISGNALINISWPLRAIRRETQTITGRSAQPILARSARPAGLFVGANSTVLTPGTMRRIFIAAVAGSARAIF